MIVLLALLLSSAIARVSTQPHQTAAAASSQSLPSRQEFAVTNPLSPFFNNVGISYDLATLSADYDGYTDSYSAQALQAAGFNSGQAVTLAGITFQWPNAQPGSVDNVVAAAQVVPVSASGTGGNLNFLGSAAHRSVRAAGSIAYSDGSTQHFELGFSDWTLNGGAVGPSFGNSIAATLPYLNTHNGPRMERTYLFVTTVPLQPGKRIASVTLPSDTHLHLFGLTVATNGSGLGGGSPPQATNTPVLTHQATNTQSPTRVVTSTPTPTGKTTDTPIAPATNTPRPTNSATSTPTATSTATDTPRPTSTVTDTPSPQLSSTPTQQATSTPTPGTSGQIALGAMIDGAPSSPGAMDAFNALVYPANAGHAAAVNFFHNWEDASQNQFPLADMDAITARNAMPVLTWGSCQQGQHNPSCGDQAIANGSYDAYLQQWARAAAAYGKPFYLRFDHEMNGFWYPWNPGSNGNTDFSFVAMWQHVHNIFVAEGATKVRWVWCPNTTPGGTNFVNMYPGDAYVDYVGLDGYNWGPIHPRGWHSFLDEFSHDYATLGRITNKPVIIGETASTELGGDKAAWITQSLLSDVPNSFPRIIGILWFNANKETDWRVNSSPASLAAYQRVAASPLYKGQLP